MAVDTGATIWCLLSIWQIDKSGVVKRIEMKENIVQKLTSKDDKYTCAFTENCTTSLIRIAAA